MHEPDAGAATSVLRGRRWPSRTRWLFAAAHVPVLLLAWMARDDRSPYVKLREDWERQENSYWKAFQGAKTVADRRKVTADQQPNPEAFAVRCVELARSVPGTPSELSALCWAVSNSPNSPAGQQALALLKGGCLDRADPADLVDALEGARTSHEVRPNPLAPLALEVAKRNLDHPDTAHLLTRICASQFNDKSSQEGPTFAWAADMIASRFAASPDISNFCETFGTGTGSPPWAGKYENHLRTIIDKNPTRLVRCTASFALASVVQGQGEARQDEAEALYRKFLKEFDGSDPSIKAVEDNLIFSAKAEAETIRTRGIGKPAPALVGVDLDGRPLALTEFRGQVVMVSFWATWCGPCLALMPHERQLVEQFQGKPFAIVGVNGDREPEPLRKFLATTEIPWRSFQDQRPGQEPISKEWKVTGWPTIYLIDHEGIIRNRWIGSPGDDVLDRAIKQLVDKVPPTK